VLPAWLAAATVPLGVAMLVQAISYIALGVALVWVLIVSGLLYAQRAGEA
jgi:hypothetical protein